MPLVFRKKAKGRMPQLREPSQQQEREKEAQELVAVLVDAAVAIGERGTIGDYSRNDFYLWASQLIALMPVGREERERLDQLAAIHALAQMCAAVVHQCDDKTSLSKLGCRFA